MTVQQPRIVSPLDSSSCTDSMDGSSPRTPPPRSQTTPRRALLPSAHVLTSDGVKPRPPSGARSRANRCSVQFPEHGGGSVLRKSYTQALTLAKAQTAVGTVSRRSTMRGGGGTETERGVSPWSPRLQSSEPPWYRPGITPLREVCPRRALQRQRDLDEKRGRKKGLKDDAYQAKAWRRSRFGAGREEKEEKASGGDGGGGSGVSSITTSRRTMEVNYALNFASAAAWSGGPTTVPVPDERGSSVAVVKAADRRALGEDALSDSDGDVFDVGVWKLIRRGNRRRASYDICDPQQHTPFLRDQVYSGRCGELNAKVNSGVVGILERCVQEGSCYCRLVDVSFKNHALGDRGTAALLPLLTFGPRLRSLCLAGNGMREAAVRQLCAILVDVCVLTSLLLLDLSQNPLGAACAEELLRLLSTRRSLLMLGAHGTQMTADRRQLLLRHSLSNFEAAEHQDKAEALHVATTSQSHFADQEQVERCRLKFASGGCVGVGGSQWQQQVPQAGAVAEAELHSSDDEDNPDAAPVGDDGVAMSVASLSVQRGGHGEEDEEARRSP